MQFRTFFLVSLLGATPLVAQAQPVGGFYVGAGAGANFMQTERREIQQTYSAYQTPGLLGPISHPAGAGSTVRTRDSDVGAAGVVSAGYGFGNGFRVELEGNYRYNEQTAHPVLLYGREQKYGAMANALFDLDIGSRYVFPYFGAGAGVMHVDRIGDFHTNNVFAYQGIGGLAFPIPGVPNLSATLEYRYVATADSKYTETIPASPLTPLLHNTHKLLDDRNHSLMIGVRYAFNAAPPPVAAELPLPVPAMADARSYLVFFDWDRADLTERARQIIAEAARATARVQSTRIDVQGNADRTGTAAYNLGLSRRRAQAVSAELVRDGVPAGAISVEAFGETKPLVPTAAGVREPQNRRVAIILH